MKRAIFVVLAVIGVLGVLLSISQFIVAIVFGELGRVLLYFILAALCAELAIVTILKLVKDWKKDQ